MSPGVRFSGSSAVIREFGINKLVPIFQKISEVFLAAFLAQDVVAMWVPRIETSLVTGRTKYEPAEDPNARNLPFWEQAKKWVVGNLKGLNWGNFNEETLREFATGPGVLMVPTLMFSLARMMFGRTAVELNHRALKEMSLLGFVEHLKKSPLDQAQIVEAKAFRQELAKYVADSIDDIQLKQAPMISGNGQTYGQFLDDWAAKLVSAYLDKKPNRHEEISKLWSGLETTLRGYTDEHRILGYDFKYERPLGQTSLKAKIHVDKPLMKRDHLWLAFNKNEAPKQKAISAFKSDMTRWMDYADTVWQQKRISKQPLSHVAEQTYKKVMNRKALWIVPTLALTGVYMVWLAFKAASHGAYQATRLLQNKTAGAPASRPYTPTADLLKTQSTAIPQAQRAAFQGGLSR